MNSPPAKSETIGWLPLEGYGYGDSCPMDMYGKGEHAGDDDLVYVDELTGPEYAPGVKLRNPWGLDPEIADLVIELNKAGVKTIQSCQDVTDAPREVMDEVPRMGMVLVTWETFPKLYEFLPGVLAEKTYHGWLFAADMEARYVSVIFPWRDHDAWLATLRVRNQPQL